MASILIVDDSSHCRNATAALLKAAAHQVTCADNAWRGLTILESMPIDLVILDLLLPGLNGFGFVKDVQNGRHREVSLIIATALDEDPSLRAQCGPQLKEWLVKGQYSGEELLEAVDQVVGHSAEVGAAA